jgi:hypothetical protein
MMRRNFFYYNLPLLLYIKKLVNIELRVKVKKIQQVRFQLSIKLYLKKVQAFLEIFKLIFYYILIFFGTPSILSWSMKEKVILCMRSLFSYLKIYFKTKF